MRHAFPVNKDIVRREIREDKSDRVTVQIRQGIAELTENTAPFFLCQRPPLRILVQRNALYIIHDNIESVVLRETVIDLRNSSVMNTGQSIALLTDQGFRVSPRLQFLDGQPFTCPFLYSLIDTAHAPFPCQSADRIDAAQQGVAFPYPQHLKGGDAQRGVKHLQTDQGVCHGQQGLPRFIIVQLHVPQDNGPVAMRRFISKKTCIIKEFIGKGIADRAQRTDPANKRGRHAEGHRIFIRTVPGRIIILQRKCINRGPSDYIDRDDTVRSAKVLNADVHDNVEHVEYFTHTCPVALIVIIPAHIAVLIKPFGFDILFVAIVKLGLIPIVWPLDVCWRWHVWLL